MKRISEKKTITWSKTTKSLKLLLVDIKANSSILMRLEMAGMAQNKQKWAINLYEVNM